MSPYDAGAVLLLCICVLWAGVAYVLGEFEGDAQ